MAFDARQFLERLYAEPTTGGGLAAAVGDRTAEITTPDDLPPEWLELWHERAAIRHFDGGQALEHAEAEAFAEVLARMRAAEDGV